MRARFFRCGDVPVPMAKLLVVGAGYVGAELARRLRDLDHDVVAVTRTGAGIEEVADHRADVTDPDLELPDADLVYYLVSGQGRTRAAYRRAHLKGVRHVRRAVDARIVKASSTAVYGHRGGDWVDETSPEKPMNARHRLLLAGERAVRESGGTVVRLAGLYGPDRLRLDPYLDDAEVEAGYTNLIHRDDAATAMIAAARADDDLYVAVDDEPADRHEMARWLADQTDRSPGTLLDEERVPSKRCRNDRLRATGWTPEHPSYREGMAPLLAAKRP